MRLGSGIRRGITGAASVALILLGGCASSEGEETDGSDSALATDSEIAAKKASAREWEQAHDALTTEKIQAVVVRALDKKKLRVTREVTFNRNQFGIPGDWFGRFSPPITIAQGLEYKLGDFSCTLSNGSKYVDGIAAGTEFEISRVQHKNTMYFKTREEDSEGRAKYELSIGFRFSATLDGTTPEAKDRAMDFDCVVKDAGMLNRYYFEVPSD